MNKILTIILFTVLSFSINAQTNTDNLVKDAKEYNQAFLNGDFDKFTTMTIESVVKLAGGHDVMKENTQQSSKLNSSSGLKTISITPGDVSEIKKSGNQLHAILAQTVINQVGTTKFSRVMYYLAVSKDNGTSWTFLDLEPYGNESIKTFVPSFTGELSIPEFEQPEIIKD